MAKKRKGAAFYGEIDFILSERYTKRYRKSIRSSRIFNKFNLIEKIFVINLKQLKN